IPILKAYSGFQNSNRFFQPIIKYQRMESKSLIYIPTNKNRTPIIKQGSFLVRNLAAACPKPDREVLCSRRSIRIRHHVDLSVVPDKPPDSSQDRMICWNIQIARNNLVRSESICLLNDFRHPNIKRPLENLVCRPLRLMNGLSNRPEAWRNIYEAA